MKKGGGKTQLKQLTYNSKFALTSISGLHSTLRNLLVDVNSSRISGDLQKTARISLSLVVN